MAVVRPSYLGHRLKITKLKLNHGLLGIFRAAPAEAGAPATDVMLESGAIQ